MVIVVPTIIPPPSVQARDWTYFPPLGRRSNGGGGAGSMPMWRRARGYRNTANDNIVLILMIETLEGVKNSAEIAKVPGVSAVFAASGRPGEFLRLSAGLARLRTRDQHRARRRDRRRAWLCTVAWAIVLTSPASSRSERRRSRVRPPELGPLANTKGSRKSGRMPGAPLEGRTLRSALFRAVVVRPPALIGLSASRPSVRRTS